MRKFANLCNIMPNFQLVPLNALRFLKPWLLVFVIIWYLTYQIINPSGESNQVVYVPKHGASCDV